MLSIAFNPSLEWARRFYNNYQRAYPSTLNFTIVFFNLKPNEILILSMCKIFHSQVMTLLWIINRNNSKTSPCKLFPANCIFSHSVDVLLRLMPRYLIKNLSILAGDWTYGSDRFCILRRVCESSSITQPYCHLNMVSQLMDAIAVVVFWGHILPLPECLALQNYKNVNLSKLNPKNVLTRSVFILDCR